MAEEKQIPLDELLFGPKRDSTAKPEQCLVDLLASWHHKVLARMLPDQAVQRSSLKQPPGEPKR
jgi:hypothetical protein